MSIEVKELPLLSPIAAGDGTASPEAVEVIQRLVAAIRDLEARVYALENP